MFTSIGIRRAYATPVRAASPESQSPCPAPLRHRFGIVHRLEFYPGRDLARRYEAGALCFQARSSADLKPDETFAYVLCRDVIEYAPSPRGLVEVVIGAARRYAVLCTERHEKNEPGPYEVNAFTREDFLEVLEGFDWEWLEDGERRMTVRLFG